MKIFKRFFSNRKKIKKINKKLKELKEENKDLVSKIRDPNYADLMRDNLKLIKLSFNGKNASYLEGLSEDERKLRITQINEIYKNESFEIMIENLINVQANFTINEAVNDAQIYAGRFNINGMALIKNEVERCHGLFEDMNKIEDFDPLEILQR